MKEYNKKIDILFFLGILLLSLRGFLNVSQIINAPNNVLDIMLLLSYICFLAKIILMNEKVKKLIVYAFIILIGIIIFITAKQPSVITLFLVVIAAKNIEIKRIVKFLFIINVLVIFVHICIYILYNVFNLEDIITVKRIIDGKEIERIAFFLGHPNTFSSYYFWTCMMYLYIKYDKINISTYIFMIFSMIFILIFPNSKTAVIGFGIVIILLITKKYIIDSKRRIIRRVIQYLPLIIGVFSLLSILFYNLKFIQVIDNFYTGRIVVARGVYETYGIKLFGSALTDSKISFLVNGKYINNISSVDSAYYSMILNSGIFGITLYIYYLQKLSNFLLKNNEIKELIFIIICVIYGMLETTCINPILAFPLLFISKII